MFGVLRQLLIDLIYWWLGGWICRWLWGYELITYITRIILFMIVVYYSSWISGFTWETRLIILGIYLITIVSMLPLIAGKILLHGNITFMLYLLYIPVILVSRSLILYIPVIPVSW